MRISKLSEIQTAFSAIRPGKIPDEDWKLITQLAGQYRRFKEDGLEDDEILAHEVHGPNMQGLIQLINHTLESLGGNGGKPEPEQDTAPKKVNSPKKKTPPKSSRRKKAPSKSTVPAASRSQSAKKEPPASKEFLRSFTAEMALLLRLARMIGNKRTGKQVLALIQAIQKAILKGLVRKKVDPSPYHKEIEWSQKKLVDFFNQHFKGKDPTHSETLSFSGKMADSILELKKTHDIFPSVRLSLRYLGLMERSDKREEAGKLLKAIQKAEDDEKLQADHPGVALLKKAKTQLKNFTTGKSNSPLLQRAELSGLARSCSCSSGNLSGIDGGALMVPPPRGVPPVLRRSTDPRTGAGRERLAFQGRWKQLFSEPGRGFTVLLWGKAKSGKSTLALDFAHFLASNFGPTLYASLEEDPEGPTFEDRETRLGAVHPSLYTVNHLPMNLGKYDFVFIDSVSWGKMGTDLIKELIEKWPRTTFVFITHATNDGLPRGGMVYQHLVDVLVSVNKGKATADGRYGPGEARVRFS